MAESDLKRYVKLHSATGQYEDCECVIQFTYAINSPIAKCKCSVNYKTNGSISAKAIT